LGMGDEPAPLPGVGLSLETTALLRRQLQQGQVRARLTTQCQVQRVTARNIVADLPGMDPDAGWIVVCGHYDGHDIAQGAQDNATGTALVLETARLLAPLREHLQAGLRFVLFSGEELGMFGSENYVRVHAGELDHILTVFNADVVGLAAPLTLMVQNSPELGAYLHSLPMSELDVQVVDNRLVPYSDHFPFTLDGVPALMAATSSPGKENGWAHTAADTLDKLVLRALRQAVASTTRIVLRMALEPAELATKRQPPEQIEQALIDAKWEQPLRLQGRWPF
ncbi:MAG: Zn-dependent exopeptidase M28, partial [Anaerolineae bacterium]|nr:Zn-dependent exopeptidase M28 [Anaerolineae bacterium]